MYLAHVINEEVITVFVKGEAKYVRVADPNYAKVKSLLIGGEHEKVLPLLNIKEGILQMGGGDLTIVGNEVLYQGHPIAAYQAQKLMSMFRSGSKNIEPYKKMVIRLEANPSNRAKLEFPRFADYRELPIDEEGFVYAWKGIGEDQYSIMGNLNTRVLKGKVNTKGQIFNGVGEEIEVLRSDVDDNCNNTCSHGVHAGSRDYARDWGKILTLVKFDPADVVSIPVDCSSQKMRLCRYWVMSQERKEDAYPTEPVLTVEGKSLKTKAPVSTHNYEAHLAKVQEIIVSKNLSYKDADVIRVDLTEAGFDNNEFIEDIILKFTIATKIFRYVDAKNQKDEHPTLKQIQSCLKQYSLKQSEIEKIMEDWADLV